MSRCRLLKPDVILMDLMLPGTDGVAATRMIREKYPAVQVLALTSCQEESLVQSALEAGAIGYLMKNVSAHELATAIRSAHGGKMTLPSEAAEALVHANAQAKAMDQLTERERQVLKWMVEGLNNAEIAEHLVVSLSTSCRPSERSERRGTPTTETAGSSSAQWPARSSSASA